MHSPVGQAQPGQMLLMPAGTELKFINQPLQGAYTAAVFSFDPQAVKLFQQLPKAEVSPVKQGYIVNASESLLQSMLQFLQQLPDKSLDQHWLLLRQAEMLAALYADGLLDHFLSTQQGDWKQRVLSQLQLDIGHSWRMDELAQRLSTSESTLRRQLRKEETSFQALLDEVRLAHGLYLLQTQAMTIAEIAERCGYQSTSRFTELFRRRFQITPSVLRETLGSEVQTSAVG